MTLSDSPEACVAWIKHNQDTFYSMLAFCSSQMRAGKARIRRGDVFSHVEDLGHKAPNRNAWWACLSRYLVMIEPELVRSIHFTKAQADDIDLKALWVSTVGTDPFKVNNRKEAQKIWHVS